MGCARVEPPKVTKGEFILPASEVGQVEPPKAVQPPVRTPVSAQAEFAPGHRNAKCVVKKAGKWYYTIVLTYERRSPARDRDMYLTYTWTEEGRFGRERAIKRAHYLMREFMFIKTHPESDEVAVIYPNDVSP